ncbi:class A beta-lactamase-related serine hydrolase [Lactiplantibacillus garii]|uniref:Class A beta-lactamase-related serine hydrolase n=1 Tax=Lactiplantibacillus garii TaxID=2306423 RepID=A0A3R8J523_9LACO|nr:serine hydrolase domain-containing protein [Lactiplantibacillus garii]RRK09277.1 class A beta-lactamase-related serine hydrolase [Lactiplantibacillus garii]
MRKRVWSVVIIIAGFLMIVGGGFWADQQLNKLTPKRSRTVKVDNARVTKPQAVKKVVKKKTSVQPRDPGQLTQAQAMAQIDALIKRHQIMGTLLVTTNGPKGAKVRTYGYADLNKRIRNTKTEAYPLASLQKALTATVIQHLINQGELTMTTPLSRFYPQVPYADQITIRQLLDHRSGLRMAEPLPKSILPTEAAQINFTLRHVKSTADHAYFYTNANFTILAGIIRKVSHRSYMTMLNNVIIKPLGLKHTFAYNDIPGNVVNPLAYRLTNGFSQGTLISKPLQSSELGCGSLYMSVGDYYKFMAHLQSGQLVGQAGLRELTSDFTPRYSGGVYYQPNGHIRVGGNDNAFHTYYMGTRDGRVALVLFENQGVFAGDNQVAYQIQRILMRTKKF